MIGQGADVGFNREFTMQVQDAQKALISDTAIHSNERLSPFTPIERGHLVSYSRKTRPRLTSQPSWVGASPPFRGKSVATVAARLYDPNQAQGNYENWRKACRRPHKLDDPELNAWVKRLFLQCCWSPEQIQHRLLHKNGGYFISYATIYRAIHARLGEKRQAEGCATGAKHLRGIRR